MKKEAIDFNVAVKDAFGEVVKEKDKTVMLNASIVNILNHPHALPEEKKMMRRKSSNVCHCSRRWPLKLLRYITQMSCL